jgi:SAM-dependent methyltransferase
MNQGEQEQLAHCETFFFWHRGRRVLFTELLSRFYKGAHPSILEYGCGPGGNIAFLRKIGDVSGADVSPDAIALARGKGFARLDLLSAGKPLPYSDQSFDIVTALDVLEHISDDAAAVRELYRVLRPGGVLLVSVPAFSWLWSEHDEALSHFRRYSRRELHALLSGPFTVLYSTYFCMPGVLAHFVRRCINRILFRRRETKRTFEAEYKLPPIVNTLLYYVLLCEWAIILIAGIPFGSSAVAVAQKPPST